MIFTAHADGLLDLGGRRVRCALGSAGVISAAQKREGDGATPAGVWALRRLVWRPDRGAVPLTRLPVRAMRAQDGWCDDPADPDYNRPVTLPRRASTEPLWREDGLYDLLVVLGHNDAPAVAGAGSAIFLHLAGKGYPPTRGCVALSRPDLIALLALAGPGDTLAVRPAPSE